MVLLVTVRSRADVEKACVEKLGIAADDVGPTLTAACAKIVDAADRTRDEETGKALIRLEDVYERSIRIQDAKTALATQREINKLQGLYSVVQGDAGPDGGPTDGARAELAEVREHLEPLGLGDGETSTAELARLAVAELVSRKGNG